MRETIILYAGEGDPSGGDPEPCQMTKAQGLFRDDVAQSPQEVPVAPSFADVSPLEASEVEAVDRRVPLTSAVSL